jgi:hypothetical protein
MNFKKKYGISLLLGLGLYVSPVIFDFANHISDSRIIFISGIVIFSSSIWEYWDPEATKWPAIFIGLSGLVVTISGFLLGSMGHTHLLILGIVAGVPTTLLGAREYMRTRPD